MIKQRIIILLALAIQAELLCDQLASRLLTDKNQTQDQTGKSKHLQHYLTNQQIQQMTQRDPATR